MRCALRRQRRRALRDHHKIRRRSRTHERGYQTSPSPLERLVQITERHCAGHCQPPPNRSFGSAQAHLHDDDAIHTRFARVFFGPCRLLPFSDLFRKPRPFLTYGGTRQNQLSVRRAGVPGPFYGYFTRYNPRRASGADDSERCPRAPAMPCKDTHTVVSQSSRPAGLGAVAARVPAVLPP